MVDSFLSYVEESGHIWLKANLLLVCMVQGILTSLLGPTLLDLACNTSSNLGTLAYVFTARSSGYLAGKSACLSV